VKRVVEDGMLLADGKERDIKLLAVGMEECDSL
jgi:hypothetical protein